MYATTYHRPANLAEAVQLLASNPEAKLISGGQTLIPTMKARLAAPSDLIDLGRLSELKGIREENGSIVIGAATTYFDIMSNPLVQQKLSGLADMVSVLADPAVRHRGTIGGSVANADPAADFPAAVLALNATIHTSKRKISADSFFTGLFETALEPDEILTAVSFPVPRRAGYCKFRNPASRYAMVGVYVAEQADGSVRVGVTGAGPSAFRHTEMERALASNFTPAAVANIKHSPEGLNSDIHGSAEYRAHLVTVMAKRAVEAALA